MKGTILLHVDQLAVCTSGIRVKPIWKACGLSAALKRHAAANAWGQTLVRARRTESVPVIERFFTGSVNAECAELVVTLLCLIHLA